jgi:hypothetical protein
MKARSGRWPCEPRNEFEEMNMNKLAVGALGVALLGGAAITGYLVWSAQPPPPAPVAAAPAPVAMAEPAAAPPTPAAASAPRFPMEPAASEPAGAATPAPTLEDSLIGLLGKQTVLNLLQLEGFVSHFVVTVDNLGRTHAPPRLWPVNPTAGRFSTDLVAGVEQVSAANHTRYAPFVAFVSSLDARRAVALYAGAYPSFERAYAELGFPGRHFNDRLVDVIDELLATPEPPGPVAVQRPVINGPVQPARPWVLYDFVDPQLQALHAGQKVLLRMSATQRTQIKVKLREIRAQIVQRSQGGGQKP